MNCNIAAIRQQVLDLLIRILVPQMAGTADRMPQVHGTCPKYNGNGQQALDQQGITPAEVRWALHGPPSHAPMRIASEKLFASLLLA